VNVTMGLLAYFVAGFSFGGGGSSDEERLASREKIEKTLKSIAARILVGIILTCWITMWMVLPLAHHWKWPDAEFYHGFNGAGSWSDGFGRIALSYIIDAIGVMCALVMCFALPDALSDVVGAVGSRTLYVYLLHPFMLSLVSKASECVVSTEVSDPYAATLISFIQAFLVFSLMGSTFTQRMTRCFIQPQWLVNLLFDVPTVPPDLKC